MEEEVGEEEEVGMIEVAVEEGRVTEELVVAVAEEAEATIKTRMQEK